MLFPVIPIGHRVSVLVILLILAIELSSTTSKSTTVTIPEAMRIIPGQQRRQDEERDQETRTRHKGLEDVTPSFHHNIICKITRGGGNDLRTGTTVAGTKTEKGSFVDREESIITIGVIDLSEMGSKTVDFLSSIHLVVDGDTRNDDVTVDEVLLQKNILPLFREKANDVSIESSSNEMEADVKIILESFALLCDVLVLRIGETETLAPELISHLVRGNQQRESAGMAGGKHWLIATKGPEHVLRRLTYNSDDDDDNRCTSSTTTWSTLFSSSKGDNKNDGLKELFASFSHQVIRSKRRTMPILEDSMTKKASAEDTFGDSFPPVSVLYINKKRRHGGFQGTKEKSVRVDKTTRTSLGWNELTNENKSGRTNEQEDDGEIVGDVIGMAYRRLEDLEEKMQELVLDQSSNNMPLLEFGTLVHDILQTAEMQLQGKGGMHESFRRGLMNGIVLEAQRLYKDQLQALRNYYGQRYESILNEEVEDNIHNDESIEQKWAVGAEHMTQGFLAAALNAVPAMYRTELKDGKDGIVIRSEAAFDHSGALQGLIQDMIESTERRKEELNMASILVANDEKEEATGSTSTSARKYRLPTLPKWLERLAARAFVFGVNYIQGWLAWQGIKRAALERDRNQPKFPLF